MVLTRNIGSIIRTSRVTLRRGLVFVVPQNLFEMLFLLEILFYEKGLLRFLMEHHPLSRDPAPLHVGRQAVIDVRVLCGKEIIVPFCVGRVLWFEAVIDMRVRFGKEIIVPLCVGRVLWFEIFPSMRIFLALHGGNTSAMVLDTYCWGLASFPIYVYSWQENQ